ncbi:MAG: sel1 repeat family protein [Rhodospirillaceae bacterium]|jgi:uncharacterized protein|nr:sel1 repeat family protein [Rhodospirillaceae bacterium]
MLGTMYHLGERVAQDYKEAVWWYRKAAEQGYADGQFGLGAMYANGHGVLQDSALAHMWFNIAGANGDELGADNRAKMEKMMTAPQIAEAQKLAQKCMNTNYKSCDR